MANNSKFGNKKTVIKELAFNPVKDFLKTNNKLLSCKKISQALNIKRSKVRYYCNNSKYIRSINYGEAGCYRRNLEIYKHI
jgi:response regulator of citrate/malate metabolism